jgi:hypothetical protein
MNVKIGTEGAQFSEKEYINGNFVVMTVTVPRAQKKETQARANCSAVPTQLALCLRLAIDL